MASSKREKELARQRAERQAARRAAAAQRKKQRNALIASIAAVAVVLVGVVLVGLSIAGREDDDDTLAQPQPTAGSTDAPDSPDSSGDETQRPGECTYVETGTASREVPALPPPVDVETEQPFTARVQTNLGEIVFDLATSEAPCTVNNIRSLSHFQFYTDTTCHRLTTQGIFVLQCGDPTGTGSGGPGYQFADENLEGATYPRGTVAMANAGPGTNGSQFFLVYRDTQLPPNYTPFGTITEGLDILDEVAEAGAEPEGDGMPNQELRIESMLIRPSGQA